MSMALPPDSHGFGRAVAGNDGNKPRIVCVLWETNTLMGLKHKNKQTMHVSGKGIIFLLKI